MGRFDEGIAEGKRALELDPLSADANLFLGWVLIYAGRDDEAIAQLTKALELDPNNPYALVFLGRGCLAKGMPTRAIEEMEAARQVAPDDPILLGFVGYGYAVVGRRADALKVLDTLDQMEKQRYVSPIARAYIYAGLGDKDRAFEWLEQAYEERCDTLAWLRNDPESKSLQSDPRFAGLMKKIGLVGP
jgi:tetratricopeptide (TPR) repeat protein